MPDDPPVEIKEGFSQYALLLKPHRSLSTQGFTLLMTGVCLVSFSIGVVFASMGAWPVLGFFGLDVLLVYIAFKLNFCSGRQSDVIEIMNGKLSIKRLDARGDMKSCVFDSYWSRVFLDDSRLFIRCRNESIEIGTFLIEKEKEEVLQDLQTVLQRSRNLDFN